MTDGPHAGETLKVDVGAGRNPEPGHVNVDLRDLPEVDYQAPASDLPFGDETVSRLVCHSLVPHLEDIPQVFDEFSRVLAPGATLIVTATHANSTGIVQDPDHNSWSWTSRTPEWFDKNSEFAYYGEYELELVDVDVVMWTRPDRWWLRPLAALYNGLPDVVSPGVLDEVMKLPFSAGRVKGRYKKTDK